MRIAVFSSQPYDVEYLGSALKKAGHEPTFYGERLAEATIHMARDYPAVCVFVNDLLNSKAVRELAQHGTRVIALRCAGYNNVDVPECDQVGISVVRVPAYSPYAVAEHTIALILALNRKLHRAYLRVRENYFALNGLLGFDMNGRTVGVVGTGKIGEVVCRILTGFGCRVLATDVQENPTCTELGVQYVSSDELFQQSHVITLHCPLLPETHHMINPETLGRMRDGVMLINTSRGALVDTRAAIDGLKSGKIGSLGLDVYEEEADLFFRDLSGEILHDDVFARLLTFPNVIVTAHQAFFTEDALRNIADTTAGNLSDIEAGRECPNRVSGS